MNRIYKVIWNEALSCFTAVGEYAKGRGKSSKSSVSSNATINTTSNLSVIHTLRLSTIALGLLAAGFGMQANALGTYFVGDDPTPRIHTNSFFHQTLTVQGGETVIGDPNTKNISVTANRRDKALTIKLDENVDLGTDGSLKTGDTLVDNSGIKITAINPANSVILSNSGLNNGNNKITNVSNGVVMAGSKDAINGSQLYRLVNIVKDNKTKYYSVDSEAIGNANNDGATGYNAMAMGGNAKATGSQTIAIGSSESGQQTLASGEQSIAIGANVVSKGHSSIAIGGDDLDAAANVDGVNDLFNAYTGSDLIEDPNNPYGHTEAGGAASLAVGVKARSEGNLSTAVGVRSSSVGAASSAFGVGASASRDGSVALGVGSTTLSEATEEKNLIIGNKIYNYAGVTSDKGAQVSVGSVEHERQIKHVAAGAVNTDSTDAINGSQLHATNQSIEDLSESKITFASDRGAPVDRKLGETLNIKGGAEATAALTTGNIGVESDAINNTLTVKLAENVDLGTNGSVKMGSSSSLPYSLGPVTTVNSLGVLTGNWLGSTAVNGLGVFVNGPLGIPSTVLTMDGLTIIGGPSVTRSGGINAGNKRIVNVDDGIQAKDAVNVSQLEGVKEIANKGWDISTQGIATTASTVEPGDSVDFNSKNSNIIVSKTADSNDISFELNNQLDLGGVGSIQIGNTLMDNRGFTFIDSRVMLSSRGLDNGGNTIRNVGEGVLNTDAVNVGQLKDVAIALDQGWGITAQGDIATMVKQGDAVDLSSKDGNIKVSRKSVSDVAALNGSPSLQAVAIPTNANDISFDLNPDITLNSVTTGGTVMNDDGLTIAGGPSIMKSGIDAADTKITNVQNGEVSATSQDAINGGQLYAQGTGISSIIGGDTVYNAEDGTFTNSDIGGTGESNIDGAIASIRQGTIEISENVQINTESITTNTTNIATNTTNIATNTSNITTNTTNIKTNTDKLDAGLNFGADSGANINKPIGDGSVLSFTGGNNITTTADGSSIKFDLNGNISVDSVTVGTTIINSEGISMQDGPSMTSQGLYAGNQRMTGVADGVEATDAVNYSQLSALDSRLNNNMSDLGYKIDEVEDDANAGISAAMAMSAMPQAYIAGKSLIGGGVGTYNGESAVAIGFSKLSNDGRWVIKVNGSADTQGNVGGAVGAGFHFD
ncbi:YadA-like family protein [Psychrobacter sp. 4Bb]|uniref:YadA-like family protein n=1 Tax=Psychrobacter sp. 4Bb TaxID=888436 RepID=UPI000C7D1E5B|nr:YadA-like family protein [Psychrobacter sp. 4Bb]PKH81981.1 hypothetical protein CXF60_02185 [Psychrobacter sp. 4Bb]